MATSDCYDKALGLLARRSHFRRQLEEKLRSRSYDESAIAETLDRLTELGYLDDLRVAREFVELRLRKGPVGQRRMQLELQKRGAASDAAERVLEETFSERDEREAAREAALDWLRRGRHDLAAMARHLDRLGFTTSSILGVVDEMRSERGDAGESW